MLWHSCTNASDNVHYRARFSHLEAHRGADSLRDPPRDTLSLSLDHHTNAHITRKYRLSMLEAQ